MSRRSLIRISQLSRSEPFQAQICKRRITACTLVLGSVPAILNATMLRAVTDLAAFAHIPSIYGGTMRLVLLTAFSLASLNLLGNEPGHLVPLHRFYDRAINVHCYSMDPAEIERWRGNSAMKEQRIVGLVATESLPDTTRLYRAVRGKSQRHFYYTKANHLHRGVTLQSANFKAYVWTAPGEGRVPVYSCSWTDGADVFYETDLERVRKFTQDSKNALGVDRLTTDSIPVFYVYPAERNRPNREAIVGSAASKTAASGEQKSDQAEMDLQRSAVRLSPSQSDENVRSPAATESLADVIQRCELSVVRVEVETEHGDGLGSGFVVRPGIIATNVHVLAGARTAKAVLADGREFQITSVLAVDERCDVVIATLQGPTVEKIPVLTLMDALPRKGDSVFALGSPFGLSFTATVGVVSAIRSASELTAELGHGDFGGTWIQVDAALSPGNSGGPIIDKGGNVVAMSTLASQGAQNLNFGISASDLRRMLQLAETSSTTPLSEGMQGIASHAPGQPSSGRGTEVPSDAIKKYVERGQTEFIDLKSELLKEIGRLRDDLREMRRGETGIPSSILRKNPDATAVRVVDPQRGGARVWYFLNQRVKDKEIDDVSDRLQELTRLRASLVDSEDRQGLFALLWQYGPEIDTRQAGSVGFLSDCSVVNPYNEHDVLVLFEEALYLLTLDSTTGLSPGREIVSRPVHVSGTATVTLPSGGTTSLTVLQSVSEGELRAAIDAKLPEASSESLSEFRTWTDQTGKFSVEATLVQVKEGNVELRLRDGKSIHVPMNKLSDDDQRLLGD